MKEIILKVLKRFKNKDFGKLSGYEIDVLTESFNSERNGDFFLCEEDYDFFVDADVHFYINHDKGTLSIRFSAYDKLGDVIASLSEQYEYIEWADLQDFSDQELEKLADNWRWFCEKSKESALKEYKELYGE